MFSRDPDSYREQLHELFVWQRCFFNSCNSGGISAKRSGHWLHESRCL